MTCSICLEPWGNSGSHRLVALKCGHLFGSGCIERWITTLRNKKCPQCNAKATKKDIIPIFAKTLKALDTAERDDALKKLTEERQKRKQVELKFAQEKLRSEVTIIEIKKELETLKRSIGHNMPPCPMPLNGPSTSNAFSGIVVNKKLVSHKFLDVSKGGGCRVMAYCGFYSYIAVSMPSQISMFGGYGVKKIRTMDMKADRFLPLHSKQIRDLAFNPNRNELLLSVAMDKTAKLTNITSNTVIQSYTLNMPLWCCCWSLTSISRFYVGTGSGQVFCYNTTNTIGPEKVLDPPGSGPVVSMCYIKKTTAFPKEGILMVKLNSCAFIETVEENVYEVHPIPFEGTFNHAQYEDCTNHILISCRPNSKFSKSRHIVCELKFLDLPGNSNPVVQLNQLRTFYGSTIQSTITRSCLAINRSLDETFVLAPNEATLKTNVWKVNTSLPFQDIPLAEKVIDIVNVIGHEDYVALLTDKNLRLYKWG